MPKPSETRRPLVLAAVMAAMFMIAIEATIVSTAMPQIAGQLGDLHLYAWVFASFLLTQTATTVVFGKLSDLYGRRPVLLFGIAVFLAGSLLCGLAWSMPSLILFRLVQGVGAGAIQPVSLTVVGDLYSARERGRVQGFLASVWGISSVAGPLVGGLIIGHLSWPWIFWINLPIGVIAAGLFLRFLHEGVERRSRQIDVIGAALFTAAIAALMLALTEAGESAEAALWPALAFVVAAILFVVQERRAPDPMLDIQLWMQRPIATANTATLLSGMTVIGLTAFLPMYVQGVLRQSPLIAGLTLTLMVLGWPIGATTAARSFVRFGLRPILLVGATLLPLGAIAFVALGPDTSPVVAACGSVVMGLGMGFLSTAAIVIIQDSVAWAQRGAATASNIFSRNLGSTLGATVLGAVLNYRLAHPSSGPAVNSDQLRRLLDDPGSLGAGGEAIRHGLQHALHGTFWTVFVVAVLTLLLSLLVPRVAISDRPRELAVE
ncbi:EmrB/QacA subfamily drug resistance transporter [Methylobacterium fujisawaense]|uniref:EmrB/QacA subfamily drug resistance transporter n=1 Tax=Methylobacterium fujisawaense TaxID=107400 RepID=A0ABR6D9T8_9HYPH|nr:MDR family MFS transporter [Methylobacterium fujisawaense]MBA9062840.1 EmrB/QacA subfamily drug resistance transporter [Methylobacterium fujisawaense]